MGCQACAVTTDWVRTDEPVRLPLLLTPYSPALPGLEYNKAFEIQRAPGGGIII